MWELQSRWRHPTTNERPWPAHAGHAAQLDRLLEENAALRKALEGKIEPILGSVRVRPSRTRVFFRKVVPVRYHTRIADLMKRGKS